MVSNYYLIQWRLTINWTLKNKLVLNINQNIDIFFPQNSTETVVCKISNILCRLQCTNWQYNYYGSLIKFNILLTYQVTEVVDVDRVIVTRRAAADFHSSSV